MSLPYRVFRWLNYAAIVFGFSLIAAVYSDITDWYTSLAVTLACLLFYLLTFWTPTKRLLRVKIISVLWSLYVYAIFVLSGSNNVHAHANAQGLPSWYVNTGPFVYGFTPLIILWGARLALVAFKAK